MGKIRICAWAAGYHQISKRAQRPPNAPKTLGVLANPPRGTQLLYPKAHGSLDVAWPVFLSSPLPKSLGLSFLHSRPGEAGAAGRAPTFTGVDEGAQRRRGGRGGRLARSAAGFRRPGPNSPAPLRSGCASPRRGCRPIATISPSGLFPPSLPPCPAPLPGLSAPVSLAVCPTRVARLWTPLSLPTFHLVPGSLPGLFLRL